LVQSVETRWNSAYYCLESIIQNSGAIRLAAVSIKKCPTLSEVDVEVMERVVEVLRPVERVSKLLESRAEAISSVLPAYHTLKRCLLRDELDGDEVVELKEAVRKGLDNRMVDYVKEKFLLLATALDPRYKLQALAVDDRVMARAMLQFELSREELPQDGNLTSLLCSQSSINY